MADNDGFGFLFISALEKNSGFTLVSVLCMIVVMSIAMMGASKYWQTTVKRENEKELIFRGDQIRQAIKSYYHSSKDERNPSYPQNFQALLKDPRSLAVKRHLRKPYKDPMTENGEWGVVLDKGGKLKGIFSKSKKKPLKISGFSKEYTYFENAKTYSDWRFVYDPKNEARKNE